MAQRWNGYFACSGYEDLGKVNLGTGARTRGAEGNVRGSVAGGGFSSGGGRSGAGATASSAGPTTGSFMPKPVMVKQAVYSGQKAPATKNVAQGGLTSKTGSTAPPGYAPSKGASYGAPSVDQKGVHYDPNAYVPPPKAVYVPTYVPPSTGGGTTVVVGSGNQSGSAVPDNSVGGGATPGTVPPNYGGGGGVSGGGGGGGTSSGSQSTFGTAAKPDLELADPNAPDPHAAAPKAGMSTTTMLMIAAALGGLWYMNRKHK